MLEKEFDQLSIKEKYALQKIMKKHRSGIQLSEEENNLYQKFHDRFEAEEGKAMGKWPIIIGLILMGLFGVLRSCQ